MANRAESGAGIAGTRVSATSIQIDMRVMRLGLKLQALVCLQDYRQPKALIY